MVNPIAGKQEPAVVALAESGRILAASDVLSACVAAESKMLAACAVENLEVACAIVRYVIQTSCERPILDQQRFVLAVREAISFLSND